MKEFFEKLDSKKIVIGILYVIFAVAAVIYLPKLMVLKPQSMTGETSQVMQMYNSSGLSNGFAKILQLLLAITFIVIPFFAIGNMSGGSSKRNKKYGDQGSSEIKTYTELAEYCTSNSNPKKGDIGFVLSKNVRLKASKSYEHVCILGPTGAGKSTSFFIPCLLEADGTHSFVVTDPKGELCFKCGPYLEKQGVKVIKLEPLKPKANKFYYNPLLVAEDTTQIRNLAQIILINGAKAVEAATGSSGGGSQSEWINMAVPLFAAALIYFREYGKRRSINEAIDFILNENDLDKMEQVLSKSKSAVNNFKIFKSSGGSEKTVASIKSVLTSNIQLFLDEKIEEFTKTPFTMDVSTGKLMVDESKLFDPKMLRKEPIALFVCVPETQSDYMSPLMSVFYSQLLNMTMDYYDDTYKMPILYMLDEFANIGIIPGISKLAATCRSRKMGISVGIQSVEQLSRNYGEEDSHVLLDNLKAKVIYSGLVGESAKYVSDLTGFTTVETTNYSKNSGQGTGIEAFFGTTSKSTNGTRRETMTPDEVRRLDKDKVLIILDNKQPVKDVKNSYYLFNKYKQRVREKA